MKINLTKSLSLVSSLLLVFHILQNIGMTIQLLPITGIPLPFISYGGSALWSMMTGIGIVLSIYYHEPKRYVDLYHPKVINLNYFEFQIS